MLAETRPPPPAPPRAGVRPVGSPAGWLAVGAAAVGGGLLAARAFAVSPGPCLARTHLGAPCPACGLTHLADHLLHGRLGPALAQDLPGSVLLVLLAVTAAAQVLAWTRHRTPAGLRGPALPVALGALLAAHWALTVVTGGATS